MKSSKRNLRIGRWYETTVFGRAGGRPNGRRLPRGKPVRHDTLDLALYALATSEAGRFGFEVRACERQIDGTVVRWVVAAVGLACNVAHDRRTVADIDGLLKQTPKRNRRHRVSRG